MNEHSHQAMDGNLFLTMNIESVEAGNDKSTYMQDLKDSGIERRLMRCTFSRYVVNKDNKTAYTAARHFVDNFTEYWKKGEGLTFEGTPGTGKTHLAAAIAIELVKAGEYVQFISFTDMLYALRASYSNNAKASALIDDCREADLLIIDDIGKEKSTDWVREIYHLIIDYRYRNMLPIIITTNISNKELANHIGGGNYTGEAVTRRLKESQLFVPMAFKAYAGG